MPKVEKSGIYRSESGHALWLRKDRVVNDEVAESYALDADAELSESRQAIVDAEARNAPSAGDEVESLETNTAIFPQVVEPEVAAEPVPVAPSRRARKRAENRMEPTFENRSLDDSDGDGKSDEDEAEDADV